MVHDVSMKELEEAVNRIRRKIKTTECIGPMLTQSAGKTGTLSTENACTNNCLISSRQGSDWELTTGPGPAE